MEQKTEDTKTKNIETGTLKKPMDKTITGSTFHTSTAQKGPHPKLGMMGICAESNGWHCQGARATRWC